MKYPDTPTESKAEEVARLQREIGERQSRLAHLVLGDPAKGVSMPAVCGPSVEPANCDHEGYSFEKMGRCCFKCGTFMVDWGD